MNPYTYLIRSKSTGKCYYGVRWANKSIPHDDLWNQYFTSSNEVKKLIQKHGKDDFLYEVRRIFKNKEDAIDWEEKVLKRLMVLKNPDKWMNKCVSKSIRYDIHPRLGVKLSEESKRKIGASKLGKKMSDSAKIKMSEARGGELHWNFGKKTPPKVLKKNSESNKKSWQERSKDPDYVEKFIKSSIENRVKTWILLSPFGETFEIENLSKFCRENNLHPPGIISKHYSKGWRLVQPPFKKHKSASM